MTNLSNDNLDSFSAVTPESVLTVSQDISAYKTLGFFGRINYDTWVNTCSKYPVVPMVLPGSQKETDGEFSLQYLPDGESPKRTFSNR